MPKASTRKKTPPVRELRPAELRWTCDPARYDLTVTEKEARLIGIIGQDRAIKAMKMGIELYSPGYNVFVCGISGTGRTTTVKRILDNIKSSCPLPLDRAYVHNFSQPDRPRLIVLPRAKAATFKRDMERFRKDVFSRVPRMLESERHLRRREKIVSSYESAADRLIDRFDRKVEKEGFTLKRVREGDVIHPEIFPEIDGQAVPVTEIDNLVKAGKLSSTRAVRLVKRYDALRTDMEAVARESRKILEKIEMDVAALEREAVTEVASEAARRVSARYDNEGISQWLDDGVRYLAENTGSLRPDPAREQEGRDPGEETGKLRELVALFDVNVVLDNSGREDCPVVIENLPTYRRLFGWFEKEMDSTGHWKTDYRKIRAGSILRADGGYLVLNAEDVLRTGGVWRALKRTLVKRELELYEEGSPMHIPVTSMIPQPIPINIKVILIGEDTTYFRLHERDRDFRKIFKVLADFDHEMDLNKKSLRQYAAFVARMCREESLAPFDPRAVAAVAEYGARKAGRQAKLTARFGEISDLLRESDYWRGKSGRKKVAAADVKAAVRAAETRNGMWEEKLQEMIRRGQLLIDVTGARVGQINGLVIHSAGPHSFGIPCRITATAAPGTAGIINIEREARLSGKSHDKGVLIIGGWFRERFGQDRAINFTASVAFEQSYGGVDGDSASSTEIYALVSSLAGRPLAQGIAVTGSVNQKGTIQPVGGINVKIEGFFEACRARGLTGKQGVIIPEPNVGDLMLKEEVVEAVRKKRFHIYPVSTIEEGLLILTGTSAGERLEDGSFPADTVYADVVRRLAELAKLARPLTAPQQPPPPPPGATPT